MVVHCPCPTTLIDIIDISKKQHFKNFLDCYLFLNLLKSLKMTKIQVISK